jgi:threonine 3-dehydrogenase
LATVCRQSGEVGTNVTGFKPGDLVSGEGHLVCGFCRNCLAGRRHLCPHTSGVGVNREGVFAEYLQIPMTNVWYADSRLPTDILSCFDPLGNAVHTALSFDVLGEDVITGPALSLHGRRHRQTRRCPFCIRKCQPHRLELARRRELPWL